MNDAARKVGLSGAAAEKDIVAKTFIQVVILLPTRLSTSVLPICVGEGSDPAMDRLIELLKE